jgi:RNA polymerase sigma-70 factor, ECF subfamily
MSGLPADRHSENAFLIARARAGDTDAFRKLYDSYAPRIYRFMRRMVGDQEDSADLVQELFVRAFRHLGSMRDARAFEAWLMRSAANLSKDHLRRRRLPTVPLEGDDDAPMPEIVSQERGPEDRAISSELSGVVEQALLKLAPERRAVVILHHVDEMSVEEISRLLGIPLGTVKSRLHRGRAELRNLLAGYVEGVGYRV